MKFTSKNSLKVGMQELKSGEFWEYIAYYSKKKMLTFHPKLVFLMDLGLKFWLSDFARYLKSGHDPIF